MPRQANPKTTSKKCWKCRETTLYWNKTGSRITCNVCHDKDVRVSNLLNKDGARRMLVMRRCQACGVEVNLHKHHKHEEEVVKVCWVLCVRCNFGLSYFADSPAVMKKCAEVLLGLTEGDLGDNVYDPERDGPVYVGPGRYMCEECGCTVRGNNRKTHEVTVKHQYNVLMWID